MKLRETPRIYFSQLVKYLSTQNAFQTSYQIRLQGRDIYIIAVEFILRMCITQRSTEYNLFIRISRRVFIMYYTFTRSLWPPNIQGQLHYESLIQNNANECNIRLYV